MSTENDSEEHASTCRLSGPARTECSGEMEGVPLWRKTSLKVWKPLGFAQLSSCSLSSPSTAPLIASCPSMKPEQAHCKNRASYLKDFSPI